MAERLCRIWAVCRRIIYEIHFQTFRTSQTIPQWLLTVRLTDLCILIDLKTIVLTGRKGELCE